MQCAACGTVYAPALQNTFACPKCGDPGWFPAAIPDGEDPLEGLGLPEGCRS